MKFLKKMNLHDLLIPKNIVLRQAKPADKWLIVFLVVKARLDPNQINWQNFWVIEIDNRLIAIGQLRKFALAQELGSLFVIPAWRRQGLGTFLMQHLISQATQPLYLKCVNNRLVNFYVKNGFVPIEFNELPFSLKHKFRLSQARKRFFKGFVVFMKYKASLAHNIKNNSFL
ncbi:GNAT family N-acetyltransferase [Nodularia spumigena]|uniref:GNAT family N-acetyltransferase n=1 Tax=Nodularia spumigena TaxID=70799 RepID=UPI002FEE5B4A